MKRLLDESLNMSVCFEFHSHASPLVSTFITNTFIDLDLRSNCKKKSPCTFVDNPMSCGRAASVFPKRNLVVCPGLHRHQSAIGCLVSRMWTYFRLHVVPFHLKYVRDPSSFQLFAIDRFVHMGRSVLRSHFRRCKPHSQRCLHAHDLEIQDVVYPLGIVTVGDLAWCVLMHSCIMLWPTFCDKPHMSPDLPRAGDCRWCPTWSCLQRRPHLSLISDVSRSSL